MGPACQAKLDNEADLGKTTLKTSLNSVGIESGMPPWLITSDYVQISHHPFLERTPKLRLLPQRIALGIPLPIYVLAVEPGQIIFPK